MLIKAIELVLFLTALTILLPCFFFFLECFAASLSATKCSGENAQLPESKSLVILVPAHNEEYVIGDTLDALMPQLRVNDRIVVIADNCTDETASIAEKAGAEVFSRQDDVLKGKGYALDFGLKCLASDPPDVVIFVDADCQVKAGGIHQLAGAAVLRGRPIQSKYTFNVPQDSDPKAIMSFFAIAVKNWIRPLGMARLGQPSLLFGSGMAFPWDLINSVNIANSHLVEDMKLGLDLAIAGYPPMLCLSAEVVGELPVKDQAAVSQRTRWEHGHLSMITSYSGKLLQESIRQKRIDLLLLFFDLIIPPITLLVLVWLVTQLMTGIFAFLGFGQWPFIASGISGLLLVVAILMAWYRFLKVEIPPSKLFLVLGYLVWKIPLYLKFLFRPQSSWVRTERR